jgi:hypothetical protein
MELISIKTTFHRKGSHSGDPIGWKYVKTSVAPPAKTERTRSCRISGSRKAVPDKKKAAWPHTSLGDRWPSTGSGRRRRIHVPRPVGGDIFPSGVAGPLVVADSALDESQRRGPLLGGTAARRETGTGGERDARRPRPARRSASILGTKADIHVNDLLLKIHTRIPSQRASEKKRTSRKTSQRTLCTVCV